MNQSEDSVFIDRQKLLFKQRKLEDKELKVLETKIEKLNKTDGKQIFKLETGNPENAIKIVKKGLSHNGIVLITKDNEYTFWEGEGTIEENDVYESIKSISPTKFQIEHKEGCFRSE